jgi:hypothetical protein|tara:strand:- start:266 stop:436 length:171 start_codon:yes stop_codon:yes gene_type:complete
MAIYPMGWIERWITYVNMYIYIYVYVYYMHLLVLLEGAVDTAVPHAIEDVVLLEER